MKNLYYIVAFCFAFQCLFSCGEADKEMFGGPESIYFRIPKESKAIQEYKELDSSLIFRQDTIVYSFAFDLEHNERVISIPVEITGNAASVDRKYKVKVTEYEGAKAGLHYDPISEEQIFPAGKVVDSLQIVFHRKDMDKVARKIGLTIQSGGDFIEGVKENLFVAVQVSDILEEPDWWEKWRDCFGEYHPIKYREWMKLYGGTGDLTGKVPDWWQAPYELTVMLDLKLLFETEVFEDENGVRLFIPCTH